MMEETYSKVEVWNLMNERKNKVYLPGQTNQTTNSDDLEKVNAIHWSLDGDDEQESAHDLYS